MLAAAKLLMKLKSNLRHLAILLELLAIARAQINALVAYSCTWSRKKVHGPAQKAEMRSDLGLKGRATGFILTLSGLLVMSVSAFASRLLRMRYLRDWVKRQPSLLRRRPGLALRLMTDTVQRWPHSQKPVRDVIRRWILVLSWILCATCSQVFAFAAGACPSGANYTNPANPTGPPVTLSSLGVTSCYFISAGGSDSSYDGTTETISGSHGPFLHSPGMQNCSNNCAAVSIAAGIGFIFRGGDTWHFGNSSSAPYAGVVTTCADNGTVAAGLCLDDVNGTSTNPIYYGVDQAWFTGGSWARPIFTADNSLCNSSTTGTLPDGATCRGTTDSYGQPSYYVSSCSYQVGSSNNLIDVGFSKYVTLDNFELTGLCQNHVGQPSGDDTYIRYGGANAPLVYENLYIHGASHLQFAGKNTSAQCTSSTVCTNMFVFQGSVSGTTTAGETIIQNAVDFSDSDPAGQNLCFAGFWNVAYNAFRYTTSCLPNPVHLFHDNLYEYFFENGHSNVLENIGEGTTGVNVFYNNVFRHMETYVSSGGGVAMWLSPPTSGTTDYFFNNLIYDVGALEYFNTGGTAGNNALGTYTLFNNIFQTNVNQPILRCANYTNGAITDANNQYIDDGTQYLGPCSTLTTITPLAMTNAVATSDGYTSSPTYSYLPTTGSSPTVRAGTNEGTNNSAFCSALNIAAGSDSYLTDAASACQNGTRYACTYNSTTHTMSCPAQTAVARPSSGAWDVGAYQFSSSVTGQSVQAPTNLLVSVH